MPGEGTYNNADDNLSGADGAPAETPVQKVMRLIVTGLQGAELEEALNLMAGPGHDFRNAAMGALDSIYTAPNGPGLPPRANASGEDDSLGLEVGPAEVSAQADSSGALEEMVKRLLSNGAASPRSLRPRP